MLVSSFRRLPLFACEPSSLLLRVSDKVEISIHTVARAAR
jgi:hypothetical protein